MSINQSEMLVPLSCLFASPADGALEGCLASLQTSFVIILTYVIPLLLLLPVRYTDPGAKLCLSVSKYAVAALFYLHRFLNIHISDDGINVLLLVFSGTNWHTVLNMHTKLKHVSSQTCRNMIPMVSMQLLILRVHLLFSTTKILVPQFLPPWWKFILFSIINIFFSVFVTVLIWFNSLNNSSLSSLGRNIVYALSLKFVFRDNVYLTSRLSNSCLHI